jgi:hypothetical protein
MIHDLLDYYRTRGRADIKANLLVICDPIFDVKLLHHPYQPHLYLTRDIHSWHRLYISLE